MTRASHTKGIKGGNAIVPGTPPYQGRTVLIYFCIDRRIEWVRPPQKRLHMGICLSWTFWRKRCFNIFAVIPLDVCTFAPVQGVSILTYLPLWSLKTPLQMGKDLGLTPACCDWGHCCSATACWTLCLLCWRPPRTFDTYWCLQVWSQCFSFSSVCSSFAVNVFTWNNPNLIVNDPSFWLVCN